MTETTVLAGHQLTQPDYRRKSIRELPSVADGDGRLENTLAGSHHISKVREVLVHSVHLHQRSKVRKVLIHAAHLREARCCQLGGAKTATQLLQQDIRIALTVVMQEPPDPPQELRIAHFTHATRHTHFPLSGDLGRNVQRNN